MIAFIGAILYVVFPPVAFSQLIYIVFSKQIGLLFFLISLLFFLHKRQFAFEIFLLLTLLMTLEYIVLFLFFPLFLFPTLWKFKLSDYKRYLLKLSLFLAFIFFSLMKQGSIMGDFKNFFEFLLFPIHLIQVFIEGGFYYSIQSLFQSPTALFRDFSSTLFIGFSIIVLSGLIIYEFSKDKINTNQRNKPKLYHIETAAFSLKTHIAPEAVHNLYTFLIGLLLFIFAYSGYKEHAYFGVKNSPETWVFLTAVLPMVLMICSCLELLLHVIKNRIFKLILITFFVCYLGLLGADRLYMQKSLVQAWSRQQWLWTNILADLSALDQNWKIKVNLMNEGSFETLGNGSKFNLFNNMMSDLFQQPDSWDTFPEIEFIDQLTPQISTPENEIWITKRFMVNNGYLELDPETAINIELTGESTMLTMDKLEKKALYHLLYNEAFLDIPLSNLVEQEGH